MNYAPTLSTKVRMSEIWNEECQLRASLHDSHVQEFYYMLTPEDHIMTAEEFDAAVEIAKQGAAS